MANTPSFTPDPGGLDPAQVNYLATARRRIRDQYGIGRTQNAYQQRTLRSQYSRGKADLARQFYQGRQQLPSPYAQAGLLNSGLYQLGLSRFGEERRAAYGNLGGEFNDELRGLRLAARQLLQVRRQGLRDIDSEEAARRAALASSLRTVT